MSDRFSDSLLADIKSGVPISEVIGQYVVWDKEKTLPSRGDFWACCPFHNESTPSFHCEDQKGRYHCFGCGVTGDHFQFLTENQGLSFPEAVERVAELAGIPLPGDSGHREGHRQASTPPVDDRPEPPPEDPPVEPKGVMKPVKGYDYQDRDGNSLYQVIRYHFQLPDGSWELTEQGTPKKTFRQRRKVNGDWVYNLDGIEHTIYRHPQVEMAIADGVHIMLPEGEKDAETAEALGLVASTNSGGAKNWTPALAALFKDGDVIIPIDNDDVGRARGETIAKSLRGIARRIRVLDLAPHWPAMKPKQDLTDWVEAGGTREQLDAIIVQLKDWRPAPPASRFGAVGLHELHLPHLRHEFVVEGFLDRRGVAMMPGASGSGKTFLVLEMGMCVALNRPFWGMEVKPGLVVYQAGEGKEGLTKRLDGWLLDRGVDPSAEIPFKVLPRKVNLFVDDKDTDDLIAECQAWAEYHQQPVRMVVIDTFNKAITGANENAGQDMTRVLSRLERISETLDCAVVVPIHKSAEGKMRGHTSLTGDVSNVIDVTKLEINDRNSRPIRTVSLKKNKDGEDGRPMRFVLRQVVLGEDEKNKPVTTCVIERPDGDEENLAREGKLSLDQMLVLRILKDATDREGIEAPVVVMEAAGRKVVEQRNWQDAVRREWFFRSPESEPEKRSKELRDLIARTGKALRAGGYMGRAEIGPEDSRKAYVWWTGKEDRPRPKPIEHQVSAGMREAIDAGVPF